eukprot:TRINITY_DN2313_c0_g2_i1.p1 TRINITY_DN2313_c0_g2~~TRINITY_DN2313_c0_g2_i1.p1  ORF type:complete len:253 (+),score=74.24 TRINITY_DN2313_c0_g2_i1:295-1053(+)
MSCHANFLFVGCCHIQKQMESFFTKPIFFFKMSEQKEKMEERMKKFLALRQKAGVALKRCHDEVAAEAARPAASPEEQAKKFREEKEEQRKTLKEAKDMDSASSGLLSVTAETAEKINSGKKSAQFWDVTSDECQHRQYEKRTAGLERVHEVERARAEHDAQRISLGQALYPGRDSIVAGITTTDPEKVDKLVATITKEQKKPFSRRRPVDEEGKDVTFINERNRKFNEKINRAYDQYTTEIKQNIERGTAL